ncbi:MAG: hypothetical protein RXQ79_04345 [Acidilobus sp.]
MDRAAVVEGVALVVVGIIALGLYLGLALTQLTIYYPLPGSFLEENPTYEALFYNVTSHLYQSNSSGWALIMVRFNETSPPLIVMGVFVLRTGGSPDVASILQGLSVSPAPFEESSQPFVVNSTDLWRLPHKVIYLNGKLYAAAVLNITNITACPSPGVACLTPLRGSLTSYYDLSSGNLLLANLSFSYVNGTPYSVTVYKLYNVTVLYYHRGALSIESLPLLYFSYGVLAVVAGIGIAVGAARIMSAI